MKLFIIALVLTGNAWAETLTNQRKEELINLLKHDCGSCHGLTLKGGLGSSLLAKDLANKEDDFLVETILWGRKETAMPPWQQFINKQEAIWLVKYLRKSQPDGLTE